MILIVTFSLIGRHLRNYVCALAYSPENTSI
jgi:hypothetical protein